jgi:geranylgeranyl diphosphate synthase type I
VRPSAASAPSDLDSVAGAVDERVERLLATELDRWRDVDPDLLEPLCALRDLLLAGGKRLRSAFCHWAFVGAGGEPTDPLVTDAGAALELLHSFAVIHDDVIDASDHRRGRPSVHRAFADRHAEAEWRGEARRFGEGAAILIGDLAFVYADMLLADAPRQAIDVFAEQRLEVSLGQYLDLLGTARGDTGAEQARRICLYKSGKYTVERPLHLGAALAGRLDHLGAYLSAFGLPLGEAFQLRDDLLGAFGEPEVTGKPVGEDLREGKPTALYVLAMARADGAAAELLTERFGSAGLTADEVAQLQTILVETGARQRVEEAIDGLLEQALVALDGVPVTDEARARLAELAYFVASRDW